MKETEYLKIIKKALSDSTLIGDDCAFLNIMPNPNNSNNDYGIYVTHDSLVEDVHFLLSSISPYQLGKKAVNVNLSDLAAACAKPLYLTVSLSLGKNTKDSFVEEFYRGVNEVCEQYGVKVAGGDLTGSEKVFVSICAIGSKMSGCKISRSFANAGDVVVTTGVHGDSAGGLKLLLNNEQEPKSLIEAHLNPQAQIANSKILAQTMTEDFAMMDTSDGLADALYKLAKQSNVSIVSEFNMIPVSRDLKRRFFDTYKNLVLWGGEDYRLLFCASKGDYEKLDKNIFFKIGEVVEQKIEAPVTIKDKKTSFVIDEQAFSKKSFNHFKEAENE